MKLSRQQLYNMLWERGTGAVQKELGLEYIELRQICEKLNIPRPTSGYWSALNFGKPVMKTVLPPLVDGLPDEIETDEYKRKHFKNTGTVKEVRTNHKGNSSVLKNIETEEQQKSKIQSEDALGCEQKYNDENVFTVPEVLYAKDPIIFDTIAKHREQVYAKENGWLKKNPFKCKAEDFLEIHVSNNVFDRAIRIFYTIIKVARNLGYEIDTKHEKDRNGYYRGGTYFIVKGEKLSVEMNECNRQVLTPDDKWNTRKLVPSGNLRFRIFGRWGSYDNKDIKDTKCTKLEDKIEDIIHALERIADERIEEKRQQKIREEQRRIEEERKRREKEEQERIEGLRKEEREKVISLLLDVERYSVAIQMYKYIQAYKETLKVNEVEISTEIQENIDWMQSKADWINPFMNHVDNILVDSDVKKILHPKVEIKATSYHGSWNEPKEPAYNFWQMKNMFRKK